MSEAVITALMLMLLLALSVSWSLQFSAALMLISPPVVTIVLSPAAVSVPSLIGWSVTRRLI